MHRKFSFIIGVVVTCATVIGLSGCEAPITPGSTNWTAIPSDYATNSDTPSFSGCKVNGADGITAFRIKAVRPNTTAISFAVVWSTDASGAGYVGQAHADTWTDNVAVLELSVPSNLVMGISWQSQTTGYSYVNQPVSAYSVTSC